MKSLGIVRKVDELGRIVIPIEVRRSMKIKEGTPIEILASDTCIVLKKYNPGCECCGETDGLTEILGLKICPKCLKEFEKATTLINKCR